MKKLTAKSIISKVLCIAIIAVFFVLATGSGSFAEDFKEGFDQGYEMGSEMMDDYLNGGSEDDVTYADDNDYVYDDSNDYGNTGSKCAECGISIPEDRMYCDNCLYGTCITCGKKLDPADREIYCYSCSAANANDCYICGSSNANYPITLEGVKYNFCASCYLELMSE